MNLTWDRNQWQVLENSDDPKEAIRCSSATVFKHWTFTGVHIYLCNVQLAFRSHKIQRSAGFHLSTPSVRWITQCQRIG